MGGEPVIVLDTLALVWWAVGDRRLPARAARYRGAVEDGAVSASAISVREIATTVRRGRITLSVPVGQWLAKRRALSELRFEPVSTEIAALAGSFDGACAAIRADRIIAATARAIVARRVTADERLRGLPGVAAIW